MTCANCKGKVVTIKERDSFDLKNGCTQCPLIMRMNEQNMIISFNHLHSILIGRISGVAFHIFLKRIFTAPSTFQSCPNIEKDLIWLNNHCFGHMEFFCRLYVFFHHIFPSYAPYPRPSPLRGGGGWFNLRAKN